MARSVCSVKGFTSGSRNSFMDVRKSQMVSDQVPLLRLHQQPVQRVVGLIRADRRITIDSVATKTRVFPWHSIQHNA
jgi:hypothetical protein